MEQTVVTPIGGNELINDNMYTFIITVKTLIHDNNYKDENGNYKEFDFEVTNKDTMRTLMKKIHNHTDLKFPPSQQRIIFEGRQIDIVYTDDELCTEEDVYDTTDKTLVEYGFKKNTIVHLVLRLRGS